MSWQAAVFHRLRYRSWLELGSLFETVEADIPLHHATRLVMQKGKKYRRAELPTPTEARWILFLHVISQIGVETDQSTRSRKWTDRVRLRLLDGQTCRFCGGPVVRAAWTSRAPLCVACEVLPVYRWGYRFGAAWSRNEWSAETDGVEVGRWSGRVSGSFFALYWFRKAQREPRWRVVRPAPRPVPPRPKTVAEKHRDKMTMRAQAREGRRYSLLMDLVYRRRRQGNGR